MQIVDAVGNRLAARGGVPESTKSWTRTRWGVFAGRQVAAAVLEGADQFLLLGVDRDRRLLRAVGRRGPARDVAKLRVPVGVLAAFARLDVALQAVAEAVQQLRDHRVADGMAQRLERDRQRARAQAGPAQGRLGIARRRRLDQRVEIPQQRGIVVRRPLAPAARLPDPVAGERRRRVQFRSPRRIVAAERPVARATTPMPPWPSARASVAAHSRRERSVNTGGSAACFARRVATDTPALYPVPQKSTSPISISYFLTVPNVRICCPVKTKRGGPTPDRCRSMKGGGPPRQPHAAPATTPC